MSADATYAPPFWYRGRHLQTLWGPLLRHWRRAAAAPGASAHAGRRLPRPGLAGRRARAGPARPDPPRARGLGPLALRPRAAAGRGGPRLAGGGPALPLVQRRGQPAAEALPFGRDVGPRVGDRRAGQAGVRAAHRPGGRLARRQRRAQVARRAGGRGARRDPGRRRHLDAVRPGRLRPRARPGLQPRDLHRELPAHHAGQDPRQAAPLRRPPRRGRRAPGAHLHGVRPVLHRPGQRLRRRDRLLDAGEQRALSRAHPASHAPDQRDQRSVHARRRPCPPRWWSGRGGSRRPSSPRAGTWGFSTGRSGAPRGRSAARSPSWRAICYDDRRAS